MCLLNDFPLRSAPPKKVLELPLPWVLLSYCPGCQCLHLHISHSGRSLSCQLLSPAFSQPEVGCRGGKEGGGQVSSIRSLGLQVFHLHASCMATASHGGGVVLPKHQVVVPVLVTGEKKVLKLKKASRTLTPFNPL